MIFWCEQKIHLFPPSISSPPLTFPPSRPAETMADAAGGNDADDPSVTRREGVPGSHLHSGDRDRARLRDVVNALATEKNLERFVREPNSNHPFFSLEDVDEVDNIKWRHLYGKEEGKIDLVLLTRELPKYLLGLLIGRELQEGEAAVFPVKSGVEYKADLMHGFTLLNELIQCQAQVCKIRNRWALSTVFLARPPTPF